MVLGLPHVPHLLKGQNALDDYAAVLISRLDAFIPEPVNETTASLGAKANHAS